MRFVSYIFCLVFLFCSAAVAQIGDNPREISVYASLCEGIINNESKSSARVRAVDKASFKAVEEIPELSQYKKSLDNHNFNLKVYRLVDNYLEDVKINTTGQNENQVCVEVNAYLPEDAIPQVFLAEPEDDNSLSDIEPDVLALEIEEEPAGNVNIAIPPKPEIVINKEIAYEQNKEISKDNSEKNSLEAQSVEQTLPTKVFVDKTEFYNGTVTGGFFAHLEQALLEKSGIKVMAEQGKSDYILKSKILKAKIDNINSETGRLQIVVALELIDTATSERITEHQNRFILFNSSDDAQKTAADLTRKLLAEGVAKLLPKIKTNIPATKKSAIITPN